MSEALEILRELRGAIALMAEEGGAKRRVPRSLLQQVSELGAALAAPGMLPAGGTPAAASAPLRAAAPTAERPPTPESRMGVTRPEPVGEREAMLAAIASEVAACKACRLHEGRTNTVPGQGNPAPEILFVGEGPGADEDEQGLAFVGRAGQLLTKMIEAMGYRRDEVFIANIVKCRPPNNRPPEPDEMRTCLPFLKRQIAVLRPRVIVALGATAVRGLLGVEQGISKVRGTWMTYEGIDAMPTYHPSYLLRNPAAKKDVWADLKTVLAKLGRTPPPVPKGG